MNAPAPGFRLEIHEALPSTSDHVAARGAMGEAAGLAVLARRQTAGRGTQGRSWDSPAGNLHLSVLLRPDGPASEAPQWSLLAAVALAEAVEGYLPNRRMLTLKWPNDLLLGQSKAAGILAEAELDANGRVASLVLGFGVNLALAPRLPDRKTASLAGLGFVPPSPEDFAEALLGRLAHWDAVRRLQGFSAIRAAWLARGPARHAPIRVRVAAGGWTTGHFAGLAEDGSLLIAGEGRVERLTVGEVAY